MEKYLEYDLGQVGLDYVEASLGDWFGMAKDAAMLPIKSGKVIALLPKGVSLERSLDFQSGGIVFEDQDVKWITNRLLQLKKKYPTCALVSQDSGFKPEDPCIVRSTGPMFFHQNVVYYYVNGHDFNEHSVERVLYRKPGSHFVYAFLLKCGINDAIQKQDIPVSTYQTILDNIEEVLIKVYDGESFLIWTPNKEG